MLSKIVMVENRNHANFQIFLKNILILKSVIILKKLYISYEFQKFLEEIVIYDSGNSVPPINWFHYGKTESNDLSDHFSDSDLGQFEFVQSLIHYKAVQKATLDNCKLNSTSKFTDIREKIIKIFGKQQQQNFESIDELGDFILKASEAYFLGKSDVFENKIFDKRKEISEALGSKDGLWEICVEKFKDRADEYGRQVFWSFRSKSDSVLSSGGFLFSYFVFLIGVLVK